MIPLTRLRGYYCNYGVDKFGIASWIYNALCHWWEKDILISRIFRLILTKIWFDLWLCNGTKVWNLVKMRIMHRDLKTINQQEISFYMRSTHRAQFVDWSSKKLGKNEYLWQLLLDLCDDWGLNVWKIVTSGVNSIWDRTSEY